MKHEELCKLIPHHGNMCLLDSVIEWNDEGIQCRAISQCDPDNPLRHNDALGAINGVEYAAQTMAVHGALLDRGANKPEVAYLASLRGVKLHCETLHEHPEIFLQCQRMGGDSSGFIYTFDVRSNESLLLEGRATVIKQKKKESDR